jgi:cell division protein FtsI/penicillin-binding protein 2
VRAAISSAVLCRARAAALPPRVAFTIMRATTGEVLAMGAWPRAASGDRWRSRVASDGQSQWRELEPPLSWLGSSAPRALASRQAVDHNFSAIEMGSAAKPFWATAALTVHPTLDRKLFVRNGDCDQLTPKRCYERRMFGVEIGKRGWQVSPGARWIDLSTYLAASDNRYHTRPAFSDSQRCERHRHDGRGPSSSGRESLTARACRIAIPRRRLTENARPS